MKNLKVILVITLALFVGQSGYALGWQSDTIKVVKQDGEMVFLILKNISNKAEIKSMELGKIISGIEKNKERIGNDAVVVQGEGRNYHLKAKGDYYYISALSRKSNDAFTVRIFESTTKQQLDAFREKAAEEGISVKYNNLQIVDGKIDAISMEVDCNDGFSGSLSVTEIPESGIGFVRDYSEAADSPFAIGKIFGQSAVASDDDSKDWQNDDSDDEDDNDFSYSFNKESKVSRNERKKGIGYNHEFEFLIGLNNYLGAGNKLPDNNNAVYSLDPITSWTYGLNSVHEVSFSPYFKSLFQFGLQWYNFALADEQYQIIENGEVVDFVDRSNQLDATRSKLNITYLNAGVVPMFSLGKSSSSFRFGAGVYGGYRIGSKSKFKYEDDGKDVNRDNFHLNSLRYGIKAQVGWKGVDLFATYDLNSLYIDNRGPQLNAIAFGLVF